VSDLGGAVLAHGIGTRADLPVPTNLAIVGGGVAVLVSFLALAALWTTPRLRGDDAGRPLPRPVEAVVDSAVTTVVLRLLVLAAAVVVVAAGLLGSNDPPSNLAGYAFYITFWVGLVPASLLLGPVWQRVNPLRTLHAGLSRITGEAPAADRLPRLGYWPAAAALLVFAWLELAYPDRTDPRVVAGVIVVYAVLAIEKRVDDPVGALAAHGICGIWGALSCGLFAAPSLANLNLAGSHGGFFYTGSLTQLGSQAVGIVVVFAFVFTTSYAAFWVIKKTYGLRVTAVEEHEGLDISEHGMYGYPEQFIPASELFGPAALAPDTDPMPALR
jgi:hypothetical protein